MLTIRTVNPRRYRTDEWWQQEITHTALRMRCPHIIDAFENPASEDNRTYAIAITSGMVSYAIAFYIDEQETLALTFHFFIDKDFYRQIKRRPTHEHKRQLRNLFTSDYITHTPYIVTFIPQTQDTARDARILGRLTDLGFVPLRRKSPTHHCYYANPADIRAVLDKIEALPYSFADCSWA